MFCTRSLDAQVVAWLVVTVKVDAAALARFQDLNGDSAGGHHCLKPRWVGRRV
jgi:hypothetical protein